MNEEQPGQQGTEEEPPRNYYGAAMMDTAGLKFRLDPNPVIRDLMEKLRGGNQKDKYGRVVYDDAFRSMNEQGIHATASFLTGLVNKNSNLSRFENEDRINRQIKAVALAYLITLVRNMKVWAPIGSEKVRNKDLVMHEVENAIYMTMLRANKGAEADITGKAHMVHEEVGGMRQQPQPRGIFGIFGGRGQ